MDLSFTFRKIHVLIKLVNMKDYGVRSMISFPGSLSFAQWVMMSSAPAKSAGVSRSIHSRQSTLFHTNVDSNHGIRGAFFLRRERRNRSRWHKRPNNVDHCGGDREPIHSTFAVRLKCF